jgi:uncharacterized surface protein with fasciclin (FAS1) repeats
MKRSISTLTTASIATLATALAITAPAHADNTTMENALKRRPELSMFYNALVKTGVIHELHAYQPYTVFAPTNASFAQYPQSEYACLYSDTPDCKAQLAEVLRSHIVPGEKHLKKMDSPGNEGDIDSLFSINNRHIVASEPNPDTYMVDGKTVASIHQLAGGELYEITGILATKQDLAKLETRPVVVVHEPPPAPLPTKVEITTTTQATTPIPH